VNPHLSFNELLWLLGGTLAIFWVAGMVVDRVRRKK
jgi:hypothetical protein